MFKIFSVFKKRSNETNEVETAPAVIAPQIAAPVAEEDWARRRAPQFENLSGWTRDWLQALPEAARPAVAGAVGVLHRCRVFRYGLDWRLCLVFAFDTEPKVCRSELVEGDRLL